MKHHRGQIALIALLVLTLAVTVGLSLIARSTSNVAITREMEESSRAFSAAEAGIEETLKAGTATSGVLDAASGLRYDASIASIDGVADTPFIFPRKTSSGETETLWLVNHNADGSIDDSAPFYTSPDITLCWSGTPPPAVVVTLLFKRGATYYVGKAAYDQDSDRAATNNFTAPPGTLTPCGTFTDAPYAQTVTFTSLSPGIDPTTDVLIALRLRPVYTDAQLAVIPSQNLPNQLNKIESVGKTLSGINRKIEVYQQYRSPSTIFDASVYSEGSFGHGLP